MRVVANGGLRGSAIESALMEAWLRLEWVRGVPPRSQKIRWQMTRVGHPTCVAGRVRPVGVHAIPGLKGETWRTQHLWGTGFGWVGFVVSHPFRKTRGKDGARGFGGDAVF